MGSLSFSLLHWTLLRMRSPSQHLEVMRQGANVEKTRQGKRRKGLLQKEHWGLIPTLQWTKSVGLVSPSVNSKGWLINQPWLNASSCLVIWSRELGSEEMETLAYIQASKYWPPARVPRPWSHHLTEHWKKSPRGKQACRKGNLRFT